MNGAPIRIYLMNHGWYAAGDYSSLQDALRRAKEIGSMQVSFHQGGDVIASWCPIGGLREYRKENN